MYAIGRAKPYDSKREAVAPDQEGSDFLSSTFLSSAGGLLVMFGVGKPWEISGRRVRAAWGVE